MEKIAQKKILGGVAISLAAILWGLDGIVLTPRLYNLDVAFVVFMLHLIPFILMQFFLFHEYAYFKNLSGQSWLALALVALFGGAIGTLAMVKALFLVHFQKLTIVVLLQKLQPVFAITLATLLLKEKLRPGFFIWATIAIVAGYFLTFGFQLPKLGSDHNMLYAAGFSLLAAFSFGSSTVFSKWALKEVRFETATFIRYGLTALILLPYIMLTGRFSELSEVTTLNWILFLIIGLTTGSGAIFLFYFGLRHVKASVSTICELFFPLSAVIFDYLFNHVTLSLVQWISAIVMIFAIVKLSLQEKTD